MSGLTPSQRQQLEEFLRHVPGINSPGTCRQLLLDLPVSVQGRVVFSETASSNITTILNAVDKPDFAADSTSLVLILLENAADMVRGSELSHRLTRLRNEVAHTPPSTLPSAAGDRDLSPEVAPLTPDLHSRLKKVTLDRNIRKALSAALLSAFPSYEYLKQLVAFGLGQNLADIAGSGTLSNVVFDLITWAESRRKVGDIIWAALEANPNNKELRQLLNALIPLTPDLPTSSGEPHGSGDSAIAISYEVRDRLQQIIQAVGTIAYTNAQERVAFLRRASIDPVWLANYDWSGPPYTVAKVLIEASVSGGMLLTARTGYTILGAVLAQIIDEQLAGLEDARYLARLIIRYKLINLDRADLPDTVRTLLENVEQRSIR